MIKIDEIKQHAFIMSQISYKNTKKETDGTNLGPLWNILSPLIYMTILSTYYQNVMPHDIYKFPVFIFIGISIFKFFRTSTQGAMKALVSNRILLAKSKASIEIFLYEKIITSLKELGYSLIALIPILLFFEVKITHMIWMLFPVLFLITVLIIGISKILAVLYVFFADLDYLYNVFLTLLMFLSAVFVPIDHLPDNLAKIFALNPIYISITLARNAIMYHKISNIQMWGVLIIWAVGFYLLGFIVFNKNKDKCINRL